MTKSELEIQDAETVLFAQNFEDSGEKKELLRLMPFGISVGTELGRPVLILKDEEQKEILPVPLSPLEAGVTISQATRISSPTSPHHVTETLLGSLGVKIQRCLFTEIKGHHQYVKLELEGHPKLSELKCRAEEAMSLCLYLGTPIFSTRAYMQKSRILSVELGQLESHLKLTPGALKRSHSYMM